MYAFFHDPEELKKFIKNAVAEGFKEHQFQHQHDPNEIVNLEKAGEILNLSIYTVRKHAKAGRIKKAMPEIKGLRFTRSELIRFSQTYR